MEVETAGNNLKFGMGESIPQEDVCPSADGMSSDATVLCIDSDVEEEEEDMASQRAGRERVDLERRLKEKGLGGGPESLGRFVGGKKKSAGGVGEEVDAELFKYVRGSKISWGREQEMAEAEAVAAALRSLEAKKAFGVGRLEDYGGQQGPGGQRWKAGEQGRSGRRKKGGNNNGMTEVRKGAGACGVWGGTERDEKGARGSSSPQQQPAQPRSNKRRGRRGGRGRKHVDRDAASEVPKLEKNLEEELAEQMANQASNESALAQSFSSLRLHVAGGGTMIILNDREITGSSAHGGERSEQGEGQAIASPSRNVGKPSKLPTPSSGGRNPVKGMGLSNLKSGMSVQTRGAAGAQPLRNARKGCGAFFPPHLLAQVHQEEKSPPVLRRVSSSSSSNANTKKLNARAQPFVPVASPVSSQHSRSASQFSHASKTTPLRRSSTVVSTTTSGTGVASGTGCFIPIYVQNEEKFTPGHKLLKASLAESLSNLSEVEFSTRRSRLKLQAPPSADADSEVGTEATMIAESTDDQTSPSNEDSALEARARLFRERSVSMGACSLMMKSQHKRNPTSPAEELLSIIDKHEEEFTTFTSPLHLEETLEGLEAEQQALEETQGKMFHLEMENTDLKNTINSINTLTSEMDKLKCANTALQVLLFVALAKPEDAKLGSEIPKGMFGVAGQLGFQELEAVKEKLTTKSSELMQIQKDLEQKNSELQVLSNTWLNGLTLRREAAESPKTPSYAQEKSMAICTAVPANASSRSAMKDLDQRSPSAKQPMERPVDTETKAPVNLSRKSSGKAVQFNAPAEISRTNSGRTRAVPSSVLKRAPVKPLWR